MAAWFIILISLSCSSALITVRVSVAGNDDSAIKVVEGQGMSMTCTTVNLPAGVTVQRYHWMHMNQAVSNANSVMLHGSRNESLAILSLSYIIHLGDYQCGITLSTGERHHSNIITLKAKFAAIFPVNGRQTVFVRNNKTAILECTVIVPTDDASAEISWTRVFDTGDHVPISNFAFGNSLLRLQSVGREDAGIYRCRVTTQHSGQGSADIRLIVVTKPQLSPQDTASDLLVGHSHDIMCAPLDTVTAVNLSWHINGEPLGSSPKLTVSSTSGSKSSRLHLTNITYADAGRYTCIATNIAGSVQQTTNVIVRGPPQITLSERLSLITVPVSMEMLVLNCPYLANPPATGVRWTRAGQTITSDGKYRIFNNDTLEVSRVTVSDSRNYSCEVTNDLGADGATYTLLVIDYPRQPHDLAVAYDPDSLRSAILTWVSPPQEANKPVTRYLLISQQEGLSSTEFGISANSTSFELTDLLPGENYEVTLQAINIAGIGATTIEFTQPVAAPSLTFAVFPETDGYSLFTRWQLQYDGGPSVSKFNIKVYENNDSQLLVYSVNPDLSEGNYRLTDLEPTTDYLLEIFISNGVVEKNMEFFTTTAIAPPSQPSTPRITLTTTNILKMTFTVRDGSCPITHFLLNTTQLLGSGGSSTTQQVIAADDALYVDSVLALSEGEEQVVLVVGGLQQLTYYSFQVAAISAVGEGEYSDSSKPSALGRILYYIVFGVVGGATIIIIITIAVAVVTLRTTRRIQRTKRTISINGSASQNGTAESFINHNAERRSSLQISSLNGPHDCTSALSTPLSSVSDYKHHMLSSSPNGIPPLYDKLSEYRKESVASDYDKRTGSVSSDGHAEQVHQVHQAKGVPMHQVPLGVTVHKVHGIPRSADMYASDGRIDSVVGHDLVDNNGASAQNTTGALSNAGKVQSTHSLFQQSAVQHLPSCLHQLPAVQRQHLLCPPGLRSMTGSSPAINYRSSCESILDKPTSYMTDV